MSSSAKTNSHNIGKPSRLSKCKTRREEVDSPSLTSRLLQTKMTKTTQKASTPTNTRMATREVPANRAMASLSNRSTVAAAKMTTRAGPSTAVDAPSPTSLTQLCTLISSRNIRASSLKVRTRQACTQAGVVVAHARSVQLNTQVKCTTWPINCEEAR